MSLTSCSLTSLVGLGLLLWCSATFSCRHLVLILLSSPICVSKIFWYVLRGRGCIFFFTITVQVVRSSKFLPVLWLGTQCNEWCTAGPSPTSGFFGFRILIGFSFLLLSRSLVTVLSPPWCFSPATRLMLEVFLIQFWMMRIISGLTPMIRCGTNRRERSFQ